MSLRGQGGWLRLLPVTLVMGAIFLLSHQSGDNFTLPPVINIDKVLHCLLYAVLGLSAFVALNPRWRQRHRLAAGLTVVVFCLLYGISDEIHQSFVAGRYAGAGDVAADAAGGVVAVIVEWSRRRLRVPRRLLAVPGGDGVPGS